MKALVLIPEQQKQKCVLQHGLRRSGFYKIPKDLIHCFEWFFSDESSLSENVHFKYSDFHLPKDAHK